MKQFKDKNILVTGGCGVIGRELIYKLVLFGAIVRCVDFHNFYLDIILIMFFI